jgi:hypothetical protein
MPAQKAAGAAAGGGISGTPKRRAPGESHAPARVAAGSKGTLCMRSRTPPRSGWFQDQTAVSTIFSGTLFQKAPRCRTAPSMGDPVATPHASAYSPADPQPPPTPGGNGGLLSPGRRRRVLAQDGDDIIIATPPFFSRERGGRRGESVCGREKNRLRLRLRL